MAIHPERVTTEPIETRLPDPWYEDLIQFYQDELRRAMTQKIVVRGDEEPWVQNRNAYVKYYLNPYKKDTATSHMQVFVQKISRHNGLHRHQGGLVIYALEGQGYTVYDGQEFHWKAGDLILLPIKPGGVDHQHFNSDATKPAMWLALITLGFKHYLANEMVQISNSPEWSDTLGSNLVQVKPRDLEELKGQFRETRPPEGWGDTYLDRLFAMRDRYRQRANQGISLVSGSGLPWEINRHGKMKWYMHPEKDDTSLRSMVVFAQEIPPDSRTGRQLHPGGLVHYVLEGRGYTVVNGQRHEWKAGDVINLPFLPGGVDYQHFNADRDRPARFIASIPNLYEALGVDLGSRFEQLENAPEFKG